MSKRKVTKYTSEFRENALNEHHFDEIKRLKKQLVQVTQERDLLKKAAVDSTCQCNIILYVVRESCVFKSLK